jgi:hypothetical protein
VGDTGDFAFYVVCLALWAAFAWALVARPVVLDRAWGAVRGAPLLLKPVIWLAFLPWLSGLAIWESQWRTRRFRLAAVALVAAAFIALWTSLTF